MSLYAYDKVVAKKKKKERLARNSVVTSKIFVVPYEVPLEFDVETST
jgi:hypothetical protein